MSGRLVWEWPVTVVSCLVVSPRRLEIVSPSGCSSAWEEEEVVGGRGRHCRHTAAVRGMLSHVFCLILCEKPENKFCRHASHSKILRQYRLACVKLQVEFSSNLSYRQTSVPTDYCIGTVNSLVGSRR
jgi:hypothetical protein